MHEIEKKLTSDILLFDGAMGTMLMERGIKAGETAETWVLDHPDEIEAVHRAYYAAGADVATTATFGATSLKLAHYKLSDRAAEINRKGAELARKACPAGKFVAGDIGPTGKLPQTRRRRRRGDAVRAFRRAGEGAGRGRGGLPDNRDDDGRGRGAHRARGGAFDGPSRLCDDLVCQETARLLYDHGQQARGRRPRAFGGRGRGGGDELLASHRRHDRRGGRDEGGDRYPDHRPAQRGQSRDGARA